ncbi:cytochrome-c peroxidase [Ferruginibacter sp. SUN106]|uniref:cytochrome-c peroxidase n=1 Tax=Ferruginibacter sp. SUN106 TaxID=2978348 RepID=UPI003D36640C
MSGKILITSIIIFSITAFSFFIKKNEAPPEPVKLWYLQKAKLLENEIVQLQKLAATANEKQLQQQFLRTRLVYKQIETITEYYFNFFAVKLNGPAIPFFEEDEPDMGQQQPNGMQLIESMLFPAYNKTNATALDEAIARLLLDTRTMQETNESDAFSEAFVFDAVTEELFRITALGITGFDSQLAINGLPECGAALKGLQEIIAVFENNFNTKEYAQLQRLLNDAQHYLQQHNNFNTFNRMEFIRAYLNPVTAIIARYKLAKGLAENKSPMFYSSIKKNNTLFDAGVFDVNKYLDDNTISPEKIALGKRLFFDTQLSVDNRRSCATCHNPAKAFTDGLSTSVAMDGHTALPRNAPTIWNAALQRNLFFDNRSSSLEDQVMQVLNNAKEMHGSAQQAAEKIIAQKEYKPVYAKAFPAAEKANAAQNICNAIACYERTLVALNSKFDKHMRGQLVLSNKEINGFNLFMGKAKCGTCHFMPLFNGTKPPRYYYSETEVIGVPDKNLPAKNKLDEDIGRFAVTNLPIHQYAFKTSTLRNIALTAPYMHNGVFKTLEQVLDFYNNGGGKGLKIAPSNQTLPFENLHLSGSEKANIILFLKTLTDTAGISERPVQSSF